MWVLVLTAWLYLAGVLPQEESAAAPNLKILEAAYRWKRQRTEPGEDGGGGEAE
jgi:hypothetical protein